MLLGLTALASALLLATPLPSNILPQTQVTSVPSSALSMPAPLVTTKAPVAAQDKAAKDAGVPVRLKTDDKKVLTAKYFAPKKSKAKVPGVILIHDQGSDSKDLQTLAKALSNKKMGVLLLELRGHGANAAKDYDWSKANEKQRKSMWAFASKDLDAASAFLGKRKELHQSKLIIIGHGKGCSLAASHAIEDRNTLAAVFIQPAEKVYDFELEKALVEMDGIPTLILCGKQSLKDMIKAKNASAPKNADDSMVEVSSLKSKPKKVLEDKRLSKYMAAWIAQQL